MMAWRRPTGRANATSSGHWSSGWKWLRATSILCFGSTHIRVITSPKKKVCNFVGGELSPLLANIALHGLEDTLKDAMPRKQKAPKYIRYADDLVVINKDYAALTQC